MQLEEAAVNFKKAAKVLLKKATNVKKPLGYTAYLRAVIQGNSEQATHLRSTKTYMVDASQAMQDLIDMAGRGKYEDETVTKPIDEAMASMNVASYMKVSGGPQARPRTMLPFNQWEETDDDAEVEVAQMLRTGVLSDHTVPSFREENGADTEQRDQLAAMGVGFQPKRENGYFDPMAEGSAKDGEAVAVFRQIDPGNGKAHHIEMSAGPYTSLAKLKVAYRSAKAKPAEGQVGVWTAAARQEKVQGGLKWLPASRPIDGRRPKGGKKTEDDGTMAEGSQSWKKLWGKAKGDLKKQGGKGPASKSTLARMGYKQGKAGAQPNPYQDEDPRHTAHKGRRGKKTKSRAEAVTAGAAILREAKQKLHPSMVKHTNSPKFKAHVGDADDSEPPYYKGKGIQKKEDAPISVSVLREGTAEMSYDSARTDRQLAKNNLKRAQQKGDERLIKKWQAALDKATADVAKYKKVAQASRRRRK